jgi:cytochrome P450
MPREVRNRIFAYVFTEWRESDIKEDILQWVARLSSHIFLGPRFSSNKEWLRIAISFTVDVMIASTICRFMPWPLRWPVERLLPLCRRVRRDYRACAKMLAPVLKERYDEIAAAEREGRQPNLPDDSIEWFRNAAHGRHYEETDLQIALQLAAIHTTSDLLCQTILDICVNTDLIQPLREEAVEVLSKYGWKKLALTELRLLDSVFKESQRLKPIAMASMHREAIADVDLGNGIKIRKGESIGVSAHQMWEEDHYEEPEKYDGFRFVKRRKIAGLENRSLLVATSNDHLGFSHGKHACPGRFFAANEVKIALVHLLLKYDMKLADPSMAKPKAYGVNQVTNPAARIQFRRRTPEIDIDNLAFD